MPRPLTIPRFREPPVEVVRQLREIDPEIHLVYLGDGVWAIGTVQPTRERERIGLQKLQKARRFVVTDKTEAWQLERLRMIEAEGDLLRQGFAPIKTFRAALPDSGIVEWFRRQTYQWWKVMEAGIAEAERTDEQVAAEAELAERHRLNGYYEDKKLKEAFRWAFKTPVSAIVNPSRIDTKSSARRRIA